MKFAKTFALAAAAASLLFVASCANTVRGVSKDVKQTGAAVEDAVE